MKPAVKVPVSIGLWFAGSSVVGVILAGSDGLGLSLRSWLAYTVLVAISILLLYLVWKTVEAGEAPRWLFLAALLAFVLRLGVGLALFRALPVYGYGEKAERAGYVYWDAYKRDRDAYARGRGDSQLIAAFTDPKRSDQYGGLLFISAGIYRYLGAEEHRPLLPVTLLAGLSSLAVILAWGVGSRMFNKSVAAGAAWIMALYPEAVLLGASQMREPFLITAFSASLYAYLVARDGSVLRGLAWLLIAIVLLALPISPAFVAVILVTLSLAWVWESRMISRGMVAALVLGLFVLIAAAFFSARAWSALEAIEGTPYEVIREWLGNTVASWRITRVSGQSVWLNTLLTEMPGSLQLPFLVLFGLVQPFLPAALVAPGSILWKSIAIWRSLGWFLILPLLIYGSLSAFWRLGWRHLGSYFGVFLWISALIASYRAPSYQWDNPRYRVVFLIIQGVLAAWAWWQGRKSDDPWLVHIFVLATGNTAIFTYWYLGRYTALPKIAFLHNVLLISLFTICYLAAVLILPKLRRKRSKVG
jgi:hypothetical protein